MERPEIKDFKRRSGRSTRIVDQAIQDLFNTGFCIVREHDPHPVEYRRTMYRIIERLKNEHGLNYKRHGDPMIDYDKGIIITFVSVTKSPYFNELILNGKTVAEIYNEPDKPEN